MIFAETYLEILSSPAHMLAELTVELLTGCSCCSVMTARRTRNEAQCP